MAETPKTGARSTERRGLGETAPANLKSEVQVQRQLAQRDFETLKALFLQAPSPILMMTGSEHRFLFVNPTSTQLLGLRSVEGLVGRTVREALPELAGTGFFEVLDEVYRSGLPFSGHEGREIAGQTLRLNADAGDGEPGSRVYFEFLYQPLRGAAGDVVGVMVQATDVTLLAEARLKAERQQQVLVRHWAEIEAIYRSAPIGLALVDPVSLRFIRANERQAEMAGVAPGELVGLTVLEAFQSCKDVGASIDGIEAALRMAASGEPVLGQTLEGELRSNQGVRCYWRLSATPVLNAAEKVDAITLVMQDVTVEKRTEAVLLESEKLAAVGRLASSIAHEINNPLESVVNLVYLANRSTSLDQVKVYLEQAEVELQRAASVTTQTLRFHKQLTNAQLVSCGDLFAAALRVYQGRFLNQRIVVEKRKRAEEPVVCMEGEIQQVLATLMSNAIDAMALGGRLLVRSRDGTDWRTGRKGLVLTVADNGTGMNLATQQRMFEAFFSTKGIGGSGLGLWVSKETMTRHDGCILVRSSMGPVWRGTVFAMFLPHISAERVRGV